MARYLDFFHVLAILEKVAAVKSFHSCLVRRVQVMAGAQMPDQKVTRCVTRARKMIQRLKVLAPRQIT